MERIKARPTIANVEISEANTEYSYTLPENTMRFSFKLRNPGVSARIAFVSGTSDIYKNLRPGETYSEEDIKYGTSVLYFQAPSDNQMAEIISWVS